MNSGSLTILALMIVSILAPAFAVNVTWALQLPDGVATSPERRAFHTWTFAPASPEALLFGGMALEEDGSEYALRDTWVLDFEGKMWEEQLFVVDPPARWAHAAAITSTQIVIFGGQSEFEYFDDTWRYYPIDDSWIQDAYAHDPPPTLTRAAASAVTIGDSVMYVFGGYVASIFEPANDMWAYDLSTKIWSVVRENGDPLGPSPREGHSATFIDDPINGPSFIIFGGISADGLGLNDAWQYLALKDEWLELSKNGAPNSPFGRQLHAAVHLNPFDPDEATSLVIFGGNEVGTDTYFRDLWLLTVNDGVGVYELIWPDTNIGGPEERAGVSGLFVPRTSDLDLVFLFGGYLGEYIFVNDLWSAQVDL